MKYKLYEVGGKIRDELIGLQSKDVDYSVVVESTDEIGDVFEQFMDQLKSEGYDIFLPNSEETLKKAKETLTIRAKFPKDHKYSGVADFVLARKELYYPESGRRPVCKLGNLRDDLERRDFTVNALAKGEDGEIIDLFNGYTDLMDGILRTPLDPYKSLKDDPLRIIRAMRFCITKGFVLSKELREAIKEVGIRGLEKVSIERVREELEKCFRDDTLTTLNYMDYMKRVLGFDIATYAFLNTGLRLEPTNKK